MNLIDILPSNFKLYIYLAAAAFVIAGAGAIYYKIDHAGYSRCEAAYAKAADEIKIAYDKNIQKVTKKYDDQKSKIYHQSGPNDLVGPRTGLALDGLRKLKRNSK